jgi:TPR repeat protein
VTIRLARLSIAALCVLARGAFAIDPGESVARALDQLDAKRYSLARAYLDPVVIDQRLTGVQRARAYYIRGFAFLSDGLYVSAAQDYQRALELDADNPSVLTELGRLYVDGIGVQKDLGQAFSLLQKGARGGSDSARLYVGYALLTGTGTQADVVKARYWLQEAADAGHVDALVQLARSYRAPYADPPDVKKACEIYERAVDSGSIDALVALGYIYLGNEAGAPNTPRATEYFRQAAERDAPAAQVALGYLDVSDKHYESAKQWFQRAVDANYPQAYAGLGKLYQSGLGVTADRARAVALYSKGAELGDVRAQLLLADIELQPPMTVAKAEAALRWLRAAAAQDHPQGRNGVAWLLATSKYERLRDGATALAEARRATEIAPSATTLDTLAAAYAETGDFDNAIETQQQAIAAIEPNDKGIRAELDRHLASYLNHQPWRE